MNHLPKPNGTSPFKVPEAYFNDLSGNVLNWIKSEDEKEPSLCIEKTAAPFTIPEGYFDTLHSTVMDSIQKEGFSLPKQNWYGTPFHVPGRYFTSLTDRIIKKVHEIHINQENIAVYHLKKRSSTGRKVFSIFLRYAAAACLIGFISLSALYYITNTQDASYQQLANNLSNRKKKTEMSYAYLNGNEERYPGFRYYDDEYLLEDALIHQASLKKQNERITTIENYLFNAVGEDDLLQEL